MTTQPSERINAEVPIKRRGLFALAAAAVAGLVAKLSEQPVSAGTDGDVILGANGVANVAAGRRRRSATTVLEPGPLFLAFGLQVR